MTAKIGLGGKITPPNCDTRDIIAMVIAVKCGRVEHCVQAPNMSTLRPITTMMEANRCQQCQIARRSLGLRKTRWFHFSCRPMRHMVHNYVAKFKQSFTNPYSLRIVSVKGI